jgi:hypothetical protein
MLAMLTKSNGFCYGGVVSCPINDLGIISRLTGNVRACQLLGHSKLESTVPYLGVDIEDAISLSEDIEI